MISIDIIEKEISDLEARDTTYNVIERLAWLYVCRDHMAAKATDRMIKTKADSPFLLSAQDKPIAAVLSIIDEHMECLQLCYPKEYNNIVDRINAL